MRLVKALRRRFLVFAAVALIGTTACVDERPAELTSADCEPTVRRPTSPRIVEVLADGSLHAGPSCATGNCLAGARGAWGYRDEKTTHIMVGERVLELPPPDPADGKSCLAAQHQLRGFVLGNGGTAAIERGAELEIATAEGSIRLPMPKVEENEEIASVTRIDGGVRLALRSHKASRILELVPMKTPPPRADARPILEYPDRLAGWLLPGTPGAILLPSGATVTLSMPIPAHATAGKDGRFIIHFDKRTLVFNVTGTLAAEIPLGVSLSQHEGVLYAVSPRVPGAVHVVTEHGLEPWLVPPPGHDLTGEALPPGSRMERLELSTFQGNVLAVERVRLRTCTVEDRLLFIDLAKKSVRTIATGDVVRLHPTFAGDRFRFIEADASYETH